MNFFIGIDNTYDISSIRLFIYPYPICNVFIYSKSMCKIYKLKVLPRSSRMHNLTFIGIIYAFVLIGCTQICDCFDLRATL